jgi:hypothetical protein
MKNISMVLLVFVLSCQQKKSTEIKSQNHTLEIDTLQSVENSPVMKSLTLDTVKQKLHEEIKQNSVEADADFQWEANEKLSKLLKHYGENMPDYFGGGFIDEKGNLVINIKGKLENGKGKVTNIIGSDNIRFKSTKYSSKELNDIMDYLNNFAQKPENKKIIINLSGWSQMENYIEVCFKKMDKNSEADFRKYVLDSEAIRFKECGEFRFN